MVESQEEEEDWDYGSEEEELPTFTRKLSR